jgi:biopolymer transport protein ExbD
MAFTVREARAVIRKTVRRVPEGDNIMSLNLTAMMDMMTILLIFLIETMAITTSPLSVAVTLPPSTTHQPEPEQSKTVTIARESILVEGLPVVRVLNGDVDAAERREGQFGSEITKLRETLSAHHEGLYKLSAAGEEPPHELTIIADKDIPYRLLYSVMYTAGQAVAKSHPEGPGFTKYRLIVLKSDPTGL